MSTVTIPAMFDEVQYRRAVIEEAATDAREIMMRAVPYDHRANVAEGIEESFAPGAFARAAADPGRVKLWLGHSTDGGRIVGNAIEIDDRDDGLWIRTRVSQTRSGDELLTLARDGVLDEASIEFAPIRKAMTVERRGNTLCVRHDRGHLKGVALVPHGAYGRHALVTSVRDEGAIEREAERERAREEHVARLTSLNG